MTEVGEIMLKFIYSLRFKFISIFFVSIFIPVVVIMYVFPMYYKQQMLEQNRLLMNNTLTSISLNISQYLSELQYLAALPYFDGEVLSALEFKDSGEHTTPRSQDKRRIDLNLSSALPAYLKLSRKDVLSVIMVDEEGSVLYSNRNRNVSLVDNYNFQEQKWYKEAVKQQITVFIGPHQPEYFTFSSTLKVFSVVRALKHPYIEKKLVVIMADADTAFFENMLSELKFSSSSAAMILDDKGEILYTTRPVSESVLEQLQNGSEYIKDKKDSYSVFSQTVVPSRWKVVILFSDNEMQNKMKWISNVSIAFAFLALILTSLIFTVLSRKVVKSLEDMASVMKQVEKGNLNVKCIAAGKDEISFLKNALNKMIIKLNNLITKEYKLVLDQRNAEYRALQSQIQPHFLYNTLNGFLGLNRLGERDTLEKSILNLTGMLRYTLEKEDMTTIEQEFNFLSRYCALQKLRFENRMNVSINCAEEVKDFKIPKLLLQPLVENSVLYAVEPSDRQCSISISADKAYENSIPFIRICIDDDGDGYNPDKVSNKKSIGISNVQERLKLTYPDSSFTIISAPKSGTHITIKIPVKEMETDEYFNS